MGLRYTCCLVLTAVLAGSQASAASVEDRIFDAAEHGRLDEARKLLAAEPRLARARNAQGETPLHLAAREGQSQAAELLIPAADIDAPNRSGWTPLHYAVWSNHKDVAALLLAKGANPNAPDGSGATALQRAAENDRAELIDLLLDSGAELDIFVASGLGRLERVDAFLKASPPLAFAMDSAGRTPLHWAARTGQQQVAERLVERGVALDGWDRFRRTPLHLALSAGRKELARWLILRGAAVNTTKWGNETPLHAAAALGDTGLVELLLAKGADPKVPAFRDDTPHEVASRRGHKEVAALLEKHGGLVPVEGFAGMHPRDALEWGEPCNGLVCALWPLRQTVVVPEGLKPQQIAVFLEVIPRRRDAGLLRVLLSWPWDHPEVIPGDIFRVLDSEGRKVACWSSPPAAREEPRQRDLAIVRGSHYTILRLPYDFSRPGDYRVSMTFARRPAPEGREIVAYYAGDLDKARQNRDNVWTGEVTSNTVTIRVARPKMRPSQ